VSFSNSLIEAWWRSLKHRWLFLHPLDNIATVKRLVEFYVTEHNERILHAAFEGQTPEEVYFGRGDQIPGELAARRRDARRQRVARNRAVACAACPRRANTSPHEPYDGFRETLQRTQLRRAAPQMADAAAPLRSVVPRRREGAISAATIDASNEGNYHVVFGSGRGAIRSRRQAVTELYEELRNRTALGQRLDAEPRGCLVSIGASAGDGGMSQCPIQEPERSHRPSRRTPKLI
jgi:hypothetical protein